MADEPKALPIDAVTPLQHGVQRGDKIDNIVGTVAKAGLVPSLRLTEVLFRSIDPSGASAIADSVAVVGSKDEISRRGDGDQRRGIAGPVADVIPYAGARHPL